MTSWYCGMSRIRDILSLPTPRELAPSIFEIDFERFKRMGFSTLLFDYDNTLAPWKSRKVEPATLELFERLLSRGFKLAVVSNAPQKRIQDLRSIFGDKVPVFGSMRKPRIKKMGEVLQGIGSKAEKTVLIGDLFFTDMIVGNRMKMHTLMVNPYSFGVQTVLNRIARFCTFFAYRVYFFSMGWFFRLNHLIEPAEMEKSLHDIDFGNLWDRGFREVIFDLDNTLAPWKALSLPAESQQLLNQLQNHGWRVFVFSNTRKTARLQQMARQVPPAWVQGNMHKPWPGKIRKAMRAHGMYSSRTVFVGDQLFTDIICANWLKTYPVKLEPLDLQREFWGTKVLRMVEKPFLKMLSKIPSFRKKEREFFQAEKAKEQQRGENEPSSEESNS